MQNKQNLNLKVMRPIFIISWVFLAVFVFLYVSSSITNEKLKKTLLELEKNTINLSRNLQSQADGFQQERRKWEEGAASYLEWRYVLKEQVNSAQQRIAAQIDETKKDKSLLNAVYYTFGLTYILAVDFEPAIKAFEEAVKFDLKDALSFYNLGLLYSAYKNDPRKAVENYKKYLELAPNSSQAEIVKERIKILEAK